MGSTVGRFAGLNEKSLDYMCQRELNSEYSVVFAFFEFVKVNVLGSPSRQ